MVQEDYKSETEDELVEENVELRLRLGEAEDTLNAIRNGEIDAVVTPDVSGGPKVYTLESADYIYRVLVQEMSEGVATLTSDGTIFYGNAQLATMLNVPSENIIGQRLKDFIPPDDLETYDAVFDRGSKSRSKGEINIKSTDGNIIPVLISINTLKDLTGAYAVITDLSQQKHNEELKTAHEELQASNEELQSITEKLEIANQELQKQGYQLLETNQALRASEKRLSKFYESGLIGVIYFDVDGKITDANDKFLEMVGYTRGDLEAGQVNWIKMTPPEYQYLDERSRVELKTTGVNKKPFEKEYIRKDGSHLPIIIAGAMLDQERFNGVAFVLDITERKRAEEYKQELLEKEYELTEELSSMNEELQATTEELKTSNEELILTQGTLKDLVDKLKTSNRELEQFAYVASHDLQEPLRMVSSFTQMLEMKYKDELDDEALEYIKFAVGGAKRMHLLINDLLAYSRVTSKDSEFEGIDLKRVMDEVIFNLEIDIEENQAVITQEPLPEIVGDYSQMVRVFQNLIGNAIKYRREEKPKIHVRVGKEPDQWLFSVEDNGIGIGPEYFGQVFQIFRRLHTQDEYGGTGIGLAITKRIIERHKGKIWVESQPEKGSTFYFTLPEIKSDM